MLARGGNSELREGITVAARVRDAAGQATVSHASTPSNTATLSHAPAAPQAPTAPLNPTNEWLSTSTMPNAPTATPATLPVVPYPPITEIPSLDRGNPHYCPGLSPFYAMPPQSVEECVEDLRDSLPDPLEPHEIAPAMRNGHAMRHLDWFNLPFSQLVAPQPQPAAAAMPALAPQDMSDDEDFMAFLVNPLDYIASATSGPSHNPLLPTPLSPASPVAPPTAASDVEVVHHCRGTDGRFISQAPGPSAKRARSPLESDSVPETKLDTRALKRARGNSKARAGGAIEALADHIIAEDDQRDARADRAMERQAHVMQSTVSPFLELGAQILKAIADDKS
jgi:hypothetical protein